MRRVRTSWYWMVMSAYQNPPRVSVVVRSYNRLPALIELLTLLLARDPRLRVLQFPPLGGPAARNTGVRHTRGDLLVFIDDDDLPVGTDWLRRHAANFADPKCLGVTGQFVEPNAAPYVTLERARRDVLSFNKLMWQRVFARTDQKKRVQSLLGGNAAIPRKTFVRFGLWDECTPIADE